MNSFKRKNSVLAGVLISLLITSMSLGQENAPRGNKAIATDIKVSVNSSLIDGNVACFKSIDCLRTELQPLIKFEGKTGSNTSRYAIRAEARNERFYAEYDNKGSLIHSEHVIIDARVPVEIYRFLASSDFKDWMVIGSERKILNLDPETTEIMVILKKGDKGKVLHFDRFGNQKFSSVNT